MTAENYYEEMEDAFAYLLDEPETQNIELDDDIIKMCAQMGIDPKDLVIMTPPAIDDHTSDLLKRRGLKNLDQKTSEELTRNIDYVQRKLGIDFTIADASNEQIRSTIRSKDELNQIELLKNYQENIERIKLDRVIEKFPSADEFIFNRDLESSMYDLTHITIDTEADQFSETILIQAFNLEAKRLVLGVSGKDYSYKEYIQSDGTTIVYLQTPNLNDAVLLADIETVIASILISALSQGHSHLVSIMEKLRKQKFISFDHDILKQILNDTRRTLFIFHNAKYDVEMLKNVHNKAKKRLNVLQNLKTENIQISRFKKKENIAIQQYVFHLGNIALGFKYNIHTKKFKRSKKTHIKIAPAQTDAYPLSWVVDTLQTAFALQSPKWDEESQKERYTLKALSHDLKYPKLEYDTDKKIFSIDDFPDPIDRYTDAMKYGIRDVFSTIDVYADLTNKISWKSISDLLEIKITGTIVPFLSQISSTASIAKHILFFYFESISGLNRKQIENNIENQRIFHKNFEKTYLGAKVETFTQGLIKSTKNQNIYYLDYASLYPHAGWLIEAETMYEKAITNQLHKYFSSNVKEVKKLIKQSALEIKESIIDNKTLEKHTIRRLIGNITYRSNTKLQLPGRLIVKGKSKRAEILKFGKVTTSIQDLTTAIVRNYFEKGISFTRTINSLNIQAVEYIDFSNTEYKEYENEFFSKLYKSRNDIKKEMINETDRDKLSYLNSQQMLLKIIMNSAYGVSAEGISSEDWTGKLFIPCVASSITATSRMLTSIAEIATDYYQALKLYTDTDSIIIRATKKQKSKICKLFENIDVLKDELGDEGKSDYTPIKQIFIARDKAYGYIESSGDIKNNIAGKGNFQDFPEALKHFYKLIFSNKWSEQNLSKFAKETSQKMGIEQRIYLDSRNAPMYRGLKKFFNNQSKEVYELNFKGIRIFIRYNIEIDGYLITNVRNLNLGQFGDYLVATPGKSKHKLIIFMSIPVDFDEIIEFILDELLVENSDSLFIKNTMKTTKWIDFHDEILVLIDEWRISEYEQSSFGIDIDNMLNYKYHITKLCKKYGFNYKSQLENDFYDLFEALSLDNDVTQRIAEISDKTSKNILEIIQSKKESILPMFELEDEFIEVGLTVYEIYMNIFTNFVKEANNAENHDILQMIRDRKLPQFRGLEKMLKSLESRYIIREHSIKKFHDYFTFNKSKFKRNYSKTIETFNVMIPKEDEFSSNDEKIRVYSQSIKNRIQTDGMTYFYKIPLANLSFSNELKANLDRYYTSNILNTIISATKHYYYTHDNLSCLWKEEDTIIHDADCRDPECKVIKAIYEKKESSVIAPKKSNVVVLPLNFKILPILNGDIIDNASLLHPNELRKLEGYRYRNDEQGNRKLVKVDKQVAIEKIGEKYKLVSLKLFERWFNQYIKYQWMEVKLFNKPWSISIEKYSSTKFNATLTINIRPEKNNYFTYRSIIGNLHLNPLSFDLVNLNLFETSIEECLDNVKIIPKIVKALFNDRDMQQFRRNQSLTIEDLVEKSIKPSDHTCDDACESKYGKSGHFENDHNTKYWRSIFYQFLAKEIIFDNLEKMQTRLTQLSISTQKEYDSKNKSLAISMCTDKIIKKYGELQSRNAKTLIKDNRDLQVYPHKASHGFSMTNTKQKFSVSVYAKDRRWLLSKTGRMTHKRNLTDTQVQRVLDTDLPDSMIRFETNLFGLETILEQPSANILNITEKFLDKSYKIANRINTEFEAELMEFEQMVPQFYLDSDYGIEHDFEDESFNYG